MLRHWPLGPPLSRVRRYLFDALRVGDAGGELKCAGGAHLTKLARRLLMIGQLTRAVRLPPLYLRIGVELAPSPGTGRGAPKPH